MTQNTTPGAFGCAGMIYPQTRFCAIPGVVAVGTDVAADWITCTLPGFFAKFFASGKTGPTGAAMIFDVLKSTDGGTTFASIWGINTANRLQIAAGASTGVTSTFDSPFFAAGDLLRIDVTQVGSSTPGSNVGIYLSTLTTNS